MTPRGLNLGKAVAAIAGLSALLLLAACGGGSEDPPATIATTAAATTTASVAAPPGLQMVAAAPSDELARLAQQLAQLRREVDGMRQQLAGLVVRPPGAPVSAQATATPPAGLDTEQAEVLRLSALESSFRAETNDSAWSRKALADVSAALSMAGETLRSQVRIIECRSRSCRVELGAEASETLAHDLPLVVGQLGRTLPNVSVGQFDPGDGRRGTVLFLSQ